MAKLPMMGTGPLAGMADKAKTALAGAKPMGDMGANTGWWSGPAPASVPPRSTRPVIKGMASQIKKGV